MKHMEIERKFLLRPCSVKKFLKRHRLAYRILPIEQFYVRSGAEGSERYRRVGKHYVHTIKSPGKLAREEWEEAVEKATYLRLRAGADSGLIEKDRYVVELGAHTYELDVFKGPLKGLNFLEVEFDSLKEAESFTLPEPFSRLLIAEVSRHPDFTNGALSRRIHLPALSEPLETILTRIRRQRKEFFKASTAVEFGPYEKMDHVLRALFFTLVSTVEANRLAMLGGDEDPERLHQFRVATRKMRVLFSRFPELFREAWLQEHQSALAVMMARTGPARDLAVALEWIPRYRQLLGARHRGMMEELEQFIVAKKAKKEKRLREWLGSEALIKELAELKSFSVGERKALSPWSEDPALPVVAGKLEKLYKKTRKEGKKLNDHSSPETYHKMRIRTKKLRYLVEFFTPILEEGSATTTLARLKKIQALLGEHQDLVVQLAWLKGREKEKALSGKEFQKSLRILEKLLEEEALRKRKAFPSLFAEYPDKTLLRTMICGD